MQPTFNHYDLLSKDIHLLGDMLGQVIRQQAGSDVFELEETIRSLAKARRADDDPAAENNLARLVDGMDTPLAEAIARAFTVYFELINLAEDNHRVRVLRERERQAYPAPLDESIPAAVAELKQAGVSHEAMARLLDRLDIELVFTAHPTEAKRRTLLSKLRRIAETLHDLEVRDLLPAEEARLKKDILAEITTLWLTERSRTSQPRVTDEVRTGLYYLNATLWDVVPQVYQAMAQALAEFYPGLTPPERFLTFGSWIGGDRDGNPNVTAEVTIGTMHLHRHVAAERHHQVTRDLDRSLSLSKRLLPVNPELLAALEANQEHMSRHVAYLATRYPREPYRLWTAHLVANLAETAADDVMGRLRGDPVGPPPPLRTEADLLAPLELIDASLRRDGVGLIADADVKQLLQQARVFGLHAARLDIRQYSAYNRAVLAELLARLGYSNRYAQISPVERAGLLSGLLRQWPPDLASLTGLSAEAEETLALFRLLRRIVQTYGPESLGPYVVSMTHDLDDILAVLLLAYWHGLCLPPDGSGEGLAITPLFETLADLKNAPGTMNALFNHPGYSRHLERLDRRQTVMIGYSDSNKDAGYLAAKWELFQAQDTLVEVCRRHNVTLTLFHGRGGTIARGGGPANRSIQAQPGGSVGGRLRVTEQGEVMHEHYSQPAIARRHLEQVVHAVLLASNPLPAGQKSPAPAWREAMAELAVTGRRVYRRLIYETPELLDYWQQATPIQEISQLLIGSRPPRRTTGEDPFAGLRAIPWGFSWMQSRHVLPGWYGLGSALESYAGDPARLALLQEMYQDWLFFKVTIDYAQMSLGKADMGIARLYAGLVEDESVRDRIFGDILAEFERARHWVLQVTGQAEILDNEPVLQRSIRLRNPYVDPLNFVQVCLLRRLRALPDPDGPEAQSILQAIFLTINGIAAGLKNTG